jgi:hypothetical protein
VGINVYAPSGSAQYPVALVNGLTYIGFFPVDNGSPTPSPIYTWQNISDAPNSNYPDNVCGIAVNQQGEGGLQVKVITSTGVVYETACTTSDDDAVGPAVCPNAWAAIVNQPTSAP